MGINQPLIKNCDNTIELIKREPVKINKFLQEILFGILVYAAITKPTPAALAKNINGRKERSKLVKK